MFCAIIDDRYRLGWAALCTNLTILRKFTNLMTFTKFTNIAIFRKFTDFKNDRCTLLQILTCIWLLEYSLISMDELNIYRNSLGALFGVSFSLSDNTLPVLVVEIGRSGKQIFYAFVGNSNLQILQKCSQRVIIQRNIRDIHLWIWIGLIIMQETFQNFN